MIEASWINHEKRTYKVKDLLSSLRVGELELYINYHNITFKGRKDVKVRVVKAHIGCKIFTSIVQDNCKTIIVYSSLDSTFAAIEETPHRIVLFW